MAKEKSNQSMTELSTKTRIVLTALRNYGYRLLNKADSGEIVLAKPLGYSSIRAVYTETNGKLEIGLVVKSTVDEQTGQKSNLLYGSRSCIFHRGNNQDFYEYVVLNVSDLEAELLYSTPVAWEMNRGVRYDFKENPRVYLMI